MKLKVLDTVDFLSVVAFLRLPTWCSAECSLGMSCMAEVVLPLYIPSSTQSCLLLSISIHYWDVTV